MLLNIDIMKYIYLLLKNGTRFHGNCMHFFTEDVLILCFFETDIYNIDLSQIKYINFN